MEKHSFYFKQFAVRHDRSSMKVGTDGVLLGAWASVLNVKSILDIGTGSGVIAIMLAQRTPADTHIDAIEFSDDDAVQAAENVAQTPWPDKVKVIHSRIQDYFPGKQYDLIVSNPPYFVNSSLPPSTQRQQARHTNSLPFAELMQAVDRMLKPSGIFAVVLPVGEGEAVKILADGHNLHVVRQVALHSRAGKNQERWLFEFSRSRHDLKSEILIVHDNGNEWSAAYKVLLNEFYLHI